MLAKTLLSILSLAAIGSSFTLPDGLPNGSYRAYYNEAGEEVHELVEPSTFNTTSSPPSLPVREKRHSRSKRASSQTWCGCNNPINAGDTNVANAGLADKAASSPSIAPGAALYTVQNTVVAFVCNKGSNSANIPTDVVSTGSWDVTYACGLFYAGTSRMQSPEGLDYGYMNYAPGLDFCGNAEESLQSNCLVDFWIGGYSGEFEAGAIAIPSDDNEGGLWIGPSLNCNDVSMGAPFPDDVDNIGEEKYDWCNVKFTTPGHSNLEIYMGGNGNKCGQVCNSATACPQGGFFAEVINADGDVPIGTCYYDASWNKDCVSDGSLMYSSRIHCAFNP